MICRFPISFLFFFFFFFFVVVVIHFDLSHIHPARSIRVVQTPTPAADGAQTSHTFGDTRGRVTTRVTRAIRVFRV